MKRAFRRVGLLLSWILIGVFGGFVLAVGLTNLFGARSLTVMSGSMEPAIGTGDVVVAVQIPPMDARVGDIVTFRDPLNHARLITHRVREIHVRGDLVTFVTKGDANSSLERWAVPRTGTIGRVSLHVPRIGYMMVWIRSTVGLLMLIVLPTLLLGASELWRLWRPRGAHEPGAPERQRGDEREPAEEPHRARDRRKRGSGRRRVVDEVVA